MKISCAPSIALEDNIDLYYKNRLILTKNRDVCENNTKQSRLFSLHEEYNFIIAKSFHRRVFLHWSVSLWMYKELDDQRGVFRNRW